jgi:hypothetical protein
MTDDHRLRAELLEGFSFAMHLHRLLAAEDSTKVTNKDEERGLVLRDIRKRSVLAVEVLHPESRHETPPFLTMRSITGLEPSRAVRCM